MLLITHSWTRRETEREEEKTRRSRRRRVGTEDAEDYRRWLGMWEEGREGAKDRKLEEEEL